MIVIEVQSQNFSGMIGPFPNRADAEIWLDTMQPFSGEVDFHTQVTHPNKVSKL